MEHITKCNKKLEKLENQLTIKERLFCKHYLINDFVGTTAAIKAGFSEKWAKFTAYKLLNKPRIKKYIAEQLKRVERKLDIKFEQKIELLWKTAQRCYGLTDDEVERIKNGSDIKMVFNFEPESLIKAVAELNKMQGHYADIKKPEESLEDVEKLKEEIKKHEREY